MNPTVTIALLAVPIGIVLERSGYLPKQFKASLASLLVGLIYPALILGTFPQRVQFDDLFHLIALPICLGTILLLGYAVGLAIARTSQAEQPASKRSIVFLALLPNYSYLPLLVASSLWGNTGIVSIAMAGIGADLVLWTIGVRALEEKKRWSWRGVLRPPLISLALAIFLVSGPGSFFRESGMPLFRGLSLFGSLTLPCSMLLLGAHLGRGMRWIWPERDHRLLLFWRLLLLPFLCFFALLNLDPVLPKESRLVVLLIASMPSAIISVALSELYDGDPDLATLQVLYGHILWLGTGPLWLFLASQYY